MRGNDRLLAILEALGEQQQITLSALADRVELPRPTTLRFLRSLEPSGWAVRKPDGQYSLGPAVLALAGQYLAADSVLVAASPLMRSLRDELGETISLSRVSGRQRTCVQEFPSTQSLRLVLGLGEQGPLHAGASGLVLLAHLSPAAREAVLAEPLPAFTDRTVTSAEDLEEECALIRERGWVLTHGQKTVGGVALAIPLNEPGSQGAVSALAVFGPEARCRTVSDERRWLDGLRRCAADILSALTAPQHARS